MTVDLTKRDVPDDVPDEGESRWATATLDAMPLPGEEPWKLSIGGMLRRHPKVPRGAGRVLGLLDRFGAIEFGPDGLGFDGEDVRWEKVIEIRTRTVDDLLLGPVSESVIDQVRDRLPPVPGRRWAVRQAVQTVTALVLAARQDLLEERPDRPPVPCEIVYLGRLGGVKRIEAGLFAALCMDRRPEIGTALQAAARRRHVAVYPAAPHDLATGTAQRAKALRTAPPCSPPACAPPPAVPPRNERDLPVRRGHAQKGRCHVSGPRRAMPTTAPKCSRTLYPRRLSAHARHFQSRPMPLPSTRKATTAQRPGGFREHTLELGQPAADSLTGIQALARQLVPG